MKITMLGTAAAEGIPALFCRCRVCSHAAEHGGRDVRMRASVLIDDVLKVDFGPDSYAQSLAFNVDMSKIRIVLISHAHDDHLTPTEFIWRQRGFIRDDGPVFLELLGTVGVHKKFKALADLRGVPFDELMKLFRMQYTEVTPFQSVSVSPYTFYPVSATHDPRQVPVNYVIERDGKRVLIGFDTAWYRDESWEYLTELCAGKPLDAAIMDCTSGKGSGGESHMSFADNKRVRTKMLERGILGDTSQYIVTHFSHGGDYTYDELAADAVLAGMRCAYDGMIIDV